MELQMADKKKSNDSEPMNTDFDSSVEVVENNTNDSQDQVSLKKIIILLFLFVIIISGGLAGVYYIFYNTSSEMVADNWHAPIATTTTSTTIPTQSNSISLGSTLPSSITFSVNQQALTASAQQALNATDMQYSLTSYGANNAQPSLMTNMSNVSVLTMSARSVQANITELTLNTVNIESAFTETQKIVRKTVINPLEPLTPNLRSSPVEYRYLIAGNIDGLTATDELADASDQLTDTEKKSDTAASLTKTDKDKKEVAQVPLSSRRKPIVHRAVIPLTLMYPELTLSFNSFIVLLPEVESKTYVDISVSVKTSNEKVFKEIQDRKTFVRGAIYAILKRIFESHASGGKSISGDEIKKLIAKDINYILINGTIDKVFITNYLTI
jgi:flagellar basal body-associated protein FliL